MIRNKDFRTYSNLPVVLHSDKAPQSPQLLWQHHLLKHRRPARQEAFIWLNCSYFAQFQVQLSVNSTLYTFKPERGTAAAVTCTASTQRTRTHTTHTHHTHTTHTHTRTHTHKYAIGGCVCVCMNNYVLGLSIHILWISELCVRIESCECECQKEGVYALSSILWCLLAPLILEWILADPQYGCCGNCLASSILPSWMAALLGCALHLYRHVVCTDRMPLALFHPSPANHWGDSYFIHLSVACHHESGCMQVAWQTGVLWLSPLPAVTEDAFSYPFCSWPMFTPLSGWHCLGPPVQKFLFQVHCSSPFSSVHQTYGDFCLCTCI